MALLVETQPKLNLLPTFTSYLKRPSSPLNPILKPELHTDLTDFCQSFQIMRSTVIRKQLFPLFLSRHTTTRLF